MSLVDSQKTESRAAALTACAQAPSDSPSRQCLPIEPTEAGVQSALSMSLSWLRAARLIEQLQLLGFGCSEWDKEPFFRVQRRV